MPGRPADAGPRAGLLVAVALALLLHAALLDGIGLGAGDTAEDAPAPLPPVQVRTVMAAPVAAPLAAPAAAPPPPRVAAARSPRPPRRLAPAKVPPAEAAPALAEAASEPVSAPGEVLAAAEPASAPASAPPVEAAAGVAPPGAAASAPGGGPPPVYRTELPPAATLEYELRRGRLSGSGTLAWRPQGERYELQLDGSVVGLRVLTQVSQGGIDAHGLAPERFTDQRARRAVLAANFRRDVGRITFSGPGVELPLWPGVQDRLSWMIQVAGILATEPARRAAGERIVLQVVGARGDAATWAFQVLGEATLETPAGPVATVHLKRESRGPYDTAVEIWLDPARHCLPLRATMRSGEDEALELRLR